MGERVPGRLGGGGGGVRVGGSGVCRNCRFRAVFSGIMLGIKPVVNLMI